MDHQSAITQHKGSRTNGDDGEDDLAEELDVLGGTGSKNDYLDQELSNTPLFTREAQNTRPNLFLSRGLLGSVRRQNRAGSSRVPQDPQIYFNPSDPWSAVVCGVQVNHILPSVATVTVLNFS